MTDKVRRAMADQIEALEAENARLRENLIAVEAERDWWQERAEGARAALRAIRVEDVPGMIHLTPDQVAKMEEIHTRGPRITEAVQTALDMAADVLDRHDGAPCRTIPDDDSYISGQMDAAGSWRHAISAIRVEDVLARMEQAPAPATSEGKPRGMQ